VHVNTSDSFDIEPDTAALTSGSNVYQLSLKTAATTHIATAVDINSVYLPDSSAQFTVLNSSAARLQVILPGETPLPGSSAGKYGSAQSRIAGQNLTVTVNLTDMFYNRIYSGVDMPTVGVTTWDHVDTDPPSKALISGSNSFSLAPKYASSTWTALASDIDAADPLFMPGVSSDVRVWPDAVHHFHFSDYPTSVVAGSAFSFRLNADDQFHNIVSTGANWDSYAGAARSVRFEAESYASPQNASVPPDYDFLTADAGTHIFSNSLTIRKSGSRWIKAYDLWDNTLSTERSLYSNRPYITVAPGNFFKVVISTNAGDTGTPVGNVEVPAGNLDNYGRKQIIAQLVDPYNNAISSAGLTVYINVLDVFGSTGTVQDGGGNVWASTTTDANGQIGFNPPLYYYVSTLAGDYARIWVGTFTAPGSISSYLAEYKNISGRLITTGGDPYELGFSGVPSSLTAGEESAGITVHRYDVFGNLTKQGAGTIFLTSNSLGANKQFRWPSGAENAVTSIIIADGASEAQFYYYDEMSSLPSGESGRTGQWTLTANAYNVPGTANIVIAPASTIKLAFANSQRTLFANRLVDDNGIVRDFAVQPQDTFANPTISTTTSIFVNLTSDRLPSPTNDFYAFSLSSTPFVATTSIEIATNTYQTRVYYKDTRASDNYTPAGTKPIIQAKETPNQGWTMGQQFVNILPDAISRTAIVSANQTLTAGATSQALLIQTQDQYSNPSPVKLIQSDPGGIGVRFALTSNSSGQKQFWSEGYVAATTGTVAIPVNSHTTSFYMIDTLVGNYTVSADEDPFLPRGWAVAVQTYTVVGGTPYKLVFATPARRLVAGTTLQFYPDFETGQSTTTVIKIQVNDFYGNISPVSSTTIISLRAVSPPVLPNASASKDGISWTPINPTDSPMPLAALTPGQSETGFYFKATLAGTVPLQVTYTGLESATQNQTITPAAPYLYTIEHPFTKANPLSVQQPGPLTVQVRDQYSNKATGDSVNGNYYTGTAIFWNAGSSSTVVTLTPSSFTYTRSVTAEQPEPGKFVNLQVTDLIQEYLMVGASEQNNPNMYGSTYGKIHDDDNGPTGDGRSVSSDHVVTVGVVMTPTDFAPEANNTTKTQFYGQPASLYQGVGTIPSKTAPVAMLRMRVSVMPNDPLVTSTATWSHLTVRRFGTLNFSQIKEISIYKDIDGGETFNGDSVLGDPYSAPDLFISSGVFTDGTNDLILTLNQPQTITKNGQTYFLCIRLPDDATKGATVGLTLPVNAFTLSGSYLARNNFPFSSFESIVAANPAEVFIEPQDICAWYDPDGIGPLVQNKFATVPQGYYATGILRLALWTPELTATWDTLKVQRSGTGSDADIISCRLYEDSNFSKTFEPATDVAISPESTFSQGIALIDLNNRIINQTTQYFFIAYKLADGAEVGKTIGGTLYPDYFGLLDGNMAGASALLHPEQAALFAIESSESMIESTKDSIIIDDVISVAPGLVTQGDTDVPLIGIRLRTDARSVIWQSIKIDRRNTKNANVDSDVANVKVYYDRGVGYLTTALSETTTGLIQLTTTYGFAPSGNLYIGDEILRYYSLDSSAQTVIIAANGRGVLNTAPLKHYAGDQVVATGDSALDKNIDQLISPAPPQKSVFVSSTTTIGLLGPKGGQEILSQASGEGKVYFIAYDIDDFCSLGQFYLGLDIKSTDYFTVNIPKQFAPNNLPVYSEIAQALEYADTVTLSPEDTTLGGSLSQSATNQAIITFTAETSKSEALFNNLVINRMGTATDADVTKVKIWFDGNDDALLNLGTTQDWVIGEGIFGDTGNSGETRITLTTSTIVLEGGYAVQPELWRKLTITAKATKRYFVTYDISDVGEPEKTLGARIAGPTVVSVSAPNFVNPAMPLFDSLERPIVASRRNVTIVPAAINVSALAQPLADNSGTIYVNSVADFPDEGGLVIDSEIIIYSSRTVANNSFTGLTRGAWNTIASAHSAGATVSRSYLQGTVNAPFLKLTASCDGFQVRWYRLKLDRSQPAGLTGYDTDVKQIRVYRDNGNGILDRDPVSGLIAADQLVSSGTAVFTSGSSNIILGGKGESYNPTSQQYESYILINTTPTIYWVTMDIDQTATKGAVLGVRAALFDYVQIGATYRDDGVHRIIDGPITDYPGDPFPFKSGDAFVFATVDTMEVKYEDYKLVSISQNAKSEALMRINLKTTQNTAIWQGLRVDLTGNCIDNDVSMVKVWKDLNGNSILDDADKVVVDGEYPGLLSYGTENFSNKTVTVTLKTPQVIVSSGSGTNYFVTYDMNSLATVGNTVGISIANTGYFIIDSPDLVEFINAAPYLTNQIPISEYHDTITFEPWPWSDPVNNRDILSGVVTNQGDTNLPVMKFRLMTDTADAIWTKMRVERIGTGAPGQPVTGSNADVAYVKIYSDSNFNQTLDIADSLISSGTDQFPLDAVGPTVDITLMAPQTLRPTPQVFFVVYDIALTATANDSVGIRVKDRSWITVSQPNLVNPFPVTAPFNSLGYFDSSLAQISPLNITVQGESIAPLVKLPGDTDVGILKLRFVSNSHTITVSSIAVQQTGSIETSPTTAGYYPGIGDGDFSRLKLWLDNGDGEFNAKSDTLLSNIPHRSWVIANSLDPNLVGNFSGALAILQCGVQVDTTGKTFFVSADMGLTDLGGRTVYRHTAGLKLTSYDSLKIIPVTAVSSTNNAFPYKSANTTIADVFITDVDVRPDKEGIQEKAWHNSNTTVGAKWEIIKVDQANVKAFKAAIGSQPNNVQATLGMGENGWSSTDKQTIEIKGLSLSEPAVVFLAEDVLTSKTEGSITVEYPDGHPKKGSNPTDLFDNSGYLTIGLEIISYSGKTATTFTGIARGAMETPIESHYKGEQVTNKAYFFKVKAETDLAGETPEKWAVVRIDLTAPSSPSNVMPGPARTGIPAEEGKFEIQWSHAKDYESGVELYEIQERVDTNPVWKTIDVVAGDKMSINVGDTVANNIQGEPLADEPRAKGHFLYYRMRAKNNAGSWGPWSAPSAPAATSLPDEVISSVSNFPNPVDTRKGGEEAKTNIVYILNQDAEVTITVYDLLGYEVMNWSFSPGQEGGKRGANRVPWDGSNEAGDKVAKGGYIVHIKVKSDRGVVTAIRKVGIIH